MKKTIPPTDIFLVAGIFGAVGIAAGAFAAHGLEGQVGDRAIAALKTGADYALLHAAALLGLGAVMEKSPRLLYWAGWFWVTGVSLFSTSLIAYGLTEQTFFMWITPFGGVAMIFGWTLVAYAGVKLRFLSKDA